MTPQVHELGNLFAERNMFLQVGLGLISLCQQFEALIAAQGTPLCTPQDTAQTSLSSLTVESQLAHAAGPPVVGQTERPPVLRLQLSGQSPSENASPSEGGPFLYFVLGLAAFSRQLLLLAEDASVVPAQTAYSEGARPYLLRRLLA